MGTAFGGFREAGRFLYLDTPLGADKLLLSGFTGEEGLSQLFSFKLNCLAENSTNVEFDKLVGQKVSFGIQGAESKIQPRHFHGIVTQMSQGARDRTFTQYSLEVAPQLWMLTKRFQSRIFQHITVPDVLKKVLEGLEVAYELQGKWEQREYCVQYRESDFDFFSRIAEEEGIFYFFKFTRGSHKLVLANTPASHSDIPGDPRLIFEGMAGGGRDEERISSWEKYQALSSGKYTMWDHHFQLPHKHLEADKVILNSVNVGKVEHKLKLAGNERLEVYDFPGRYAQRFDGIDKGGGEKFQDLAKIFEDNKRTVGLRMQEAEGVLRIQGASNCRHLTAGHKFTLQRHFNADGGYVLTSVSHDAFESTIRSAAASDAKAEETHYLNFFTCIPVQLPYRPPRLTPRPQIMGPQTAVVVGPGGEEIFTDKYGRIKVQFHWDREGKSDPDSSCWVRVISPWAGKNWGHISLPRIGQEVVVTFLDGDPDRPICSGSVYNADMMPPYKLPDRKTVSTLKSRSSKGGSPSNFNELRFEDSKGKEQVFLHAERDKDERVKAESREWVGKNKHLIVKGNHKEHVQKERHTAIDGNLVVQIGKDHAEKIGGDLAIKVDKNHQQKTGINYGYEAGMEIHLKAGMKVVIEAGAQLTLKGPGGFVDINPAGVVIQGTMVLINSGGAPGTGSGANPNVPAPGNPDEADDGTKFDKM
jgi:type VI secretion system secreted protein VgrG